MEKYRERHGLIREDYEAHSCGDGGSSSGFHAGNTCGKGGKDGNKAGSRNGSGKPAGKAPSNGSAKPSKLGKAIDDAEKAINRYDKHSEKIHAAGEKYRKMQEKTAAMKAAYKKKWGRDFPEGKEKYSSGEVAEARPVGNPSSMGHLMEKYCMKHGLKREDYALGGPSGGNGGCVDNKIL